MRLFAAIYLSPEIVTECQSQQERLSLKFEHCLRWTKAEQLHLTLKFLGEVAEENLAQVTQALNQIALGQKSFRLSLAECGCFPESGLPRVVWAGLGDGALELSSLASVCEQRFEEMGFERENRLFTPHVTIARVNVDRLSQNSKSEMAQRLRESVRKLKPVSLSQDVDRLCLVQSTLLPKGSEYKTLQEFKFGLSC